VDPTYAWRSTSLPSTSVKPCTGTGFLFFAAGTAADQLSNEKKLRAPGFNPVPELLLELTFSYWHDTRAASISPFTPNEHFGHITSTASIQKAIAPRES
jgi:hypothetical protein